MVMKYGMTDKVLILMFGTLELMIANITNHRPILDGLTPLEVRIAKELLTTIEPTFNVQQVQGELYYTMLDLLEMVDDPKMPVLAKMAKNWVQVEDLLHGLAGEELQTGRRFLRRINDVNSDATFYYLTGNLMRRTKERFKKEYSEWSLHRFELKVSEDGQLIWKDED